MLHGPAGAHGRDVFLFSAQAQTYHAKEFTSAEQNYWKQDGAVVGEWQGKLAERSGLAGAVDVLGWEFQLGVNDVQTSQIGFIAIAVAVLGRNRALGVLASALLFGALLTGTSTRNLDPAVFRADLAGNLTLIIQGLVVLFVGADVLVLWLWNRRRRLRAVAT